MRKKHDGYAIVLWKSTTILIEYARFCRVHFELLLKRSNHFSHSAYTFFVLRPFCI